MLTFLDELERWVLQQQSIRNTPVSIVYRRGRTDIPKRSADIGLESAVALGVVAVWDSGEVDAEVREIDSMSRLYVHSGVVGNVGELREVLDRALSAVLTRD